VIQPESPTLPLKRLKTFENKLNKYDISLQTYKKKLFFVEYRFKFQTTKAIKISLKLKPFSF
jgi:hypothetical protein